ncbi:rhodanese-like domain-containing protein [Streptomyces violens]|uniref:rhodanese-like domain-containing protein n=1 Tax=Streptomyces violens TaxID=66377 RepID=UPI0004C15124|nr:rhodanese-like domain-containing protein [Streptomyces violens]
MATPAAPLSVEDLRPRLHELTLIDVRTPGEYASGHIPGALNVPLDQLDQAVATLRSVTARGPLAVVCAGGNRSATACDLLADAGVTAAPVTGGTSAWAAGGHPLDHPADGRAVWPMERQVRLAAGSIVLAGVLADRLLPGAKYLSAALGAGLVFSAVTDTCGMAKVLGKLPHNCRPAALPSLTTVLRTLEN